MKFMDFGIATVVALRKATATPEQKNKPPPTFEEMNADVSRYTPTEIDEPTASRSSAGPSASSRTIPMVCALAAGWAFVRTAFDRDCIRKCNCRIGGRREKAE